MVSTLPTTDQAPERSNSGNEGQPPVRDNKRITSDEVVLRNKLTALVIDDVQTCRIVQQGFLRSYGIETQSMDNGYDALELITSGVKFNLIIVEITRQIRAMGVRCKMVGVSACNDERDRQACLEAGIDKFFEKPFLLDHLARIVRELDGQ